MEQQLHITAAGRSDIGKVKAHNEDVLLVREDLRLFAVFDGAGGHNAGEVAAALGARSLANFIGATLRKARSGPLFDQFGFYTASRHLAAALCKANRDIVEISRSHEQYRDMMSTAVALTFSLEPSLAHIAHVGDSRCYRVRDGHLELLTTDHSLLNDLVEHDPGLADAILARMPRNVLARALGKDEHVRTSFRSVPASPGDRFLLCSDGLSNMVRPPELERTLAAGLPADATAERLVEQANAAGGEDNVSALVVDVELRAKALGGPSPSLPPPPASDSIPPEIEVAELDAELTDSLLERLQRIDTLPQVLLDAVYDALQKKE